MIPRSVLICLLIGIPGFPACTKEGKAPVSGAPSQQEGQAASPSSGSGLQKSAGSLTVKILPELPTVLTDLQVVSSGIGQITYQWQRNGQVINGENRDRLARSNYVKGDTISAAVRSDGIEGTASIVIGNSLPRVISVPFSPEYVHPGTDITVKPIGQDPDGDEVGFRCKWSINGSGVFGDSPVLPGNTFKRGDVVTLKVIPYDREGEGGPFESKNIVIPKSPPRFTSNPPQSFEGNVYTYQVTVVDPEGDPITLSLAAAPAGMTIDNKTGIITWRVNEKNAGNHIIEIVAQDPIGIKVTQKYTLSVTVK